jgi:hypothetical protein
MLTLVGACQALREGNLPVGCCRNDTLLKIMGISQANGCRSGYLLANLRLYSS